MEKFFHFVDLNLSNFTLKVKEYPEELLVNRNAVVEKVLGSKLYLVSLADGTKLTARGSSSITKGMKVLVSSLPVSNQTGSEHRLRLEIKNGDRFTALIPFKVGNKTPEAKIDFYVECEKAGFLSKKDMIVYLIFTVKTTTYGQIQWSVYLRRKQILIQVYAEKDGNEKTTIIQMIQNFEISVKKKGFSLLAPTVVLKKPFKVPDGFRLNIQG
jgi:hypothetical protein